MKPIALVVDDDRPQRDLLKRYLDAEGYASLEAGNAPEARASYDEHRVDVVICDLHLGAGGTGLDVLAHVRGRDPALPFLMITGVPELETAREALRLGADDYLQKPIARTEFLHALRQASERRRLQTELVRGRSLAAEQRQFALDAHARRQDLLDAILHEQAEALAELRGAIATLELTCPSAAGGVAELTATVDRVVEVLLVVSAVSELEAGEGEERGPVDLAALARETASAAGLSYAPAAQTLAVPWCAGLDVVLRLLCRAAAQRAAPDRAALSWSDAPPVLRLSPWPAPGPDAPQPDGALALARYWGRAVGVGVAVVAPLRGSAAGGGPSGASDRGTPGAAGARTEDGELRLTWGGARASLSPS